jgi:hypothetical protein
MYDVQDYLVCPIKLLKDIVGCVRFHFADDMEHLRDRKLMFRKYSLSETVEHTVTVLTLVALSTLSRRSFFDRVRTARVQTRHPIRPSAITQML